MAKPGPKPKPTKLRILHGDRKDRINTDEPVPASVEVKRPAWLPASARLIWDRLAPDLISKGVLTHWDVDLFGSACALAALNEEALRRCFDSKGKARPLVKGRHKASSDVKNPAAQVARDTTQLLISLAGRFGLTPSDRAQLSIPPDDGGDGRGPDRLLS